MANENLVMFKKGLQADLPKSGSIENGFYLTTDTHRLYIGSNGTTALLNSAVAFYASEAALLAASTQFKPAEGDMAFVNDANALCVYKNGAWNQVNVNTDTSLYSAVFSNGEKIVTDEGKNAIKYILTVKEQDVDGSIIKNADGSEKLTTANLIITEDMVTSLVVDVKVDVTATVENNVATVKTSGAGSDGDGFKVKGEDGITIKTDGADGLIIDGTTYELSVDGTTIKLTDSDEKAAGSATITGDDDWTAAVNKDGKIEVSHKEKTVSTPDAITGTITDKKFTVVTGITTDKNHVTGIEKSEFTLPNTIYSLDSVEGSLDDEKYTQKIQLKDEGDQVVTNGEVEVKVAHKITIDGTAHIVKNGDDLGSFYSASEIDRQHKAIDAMVYRGTVASAEDLNKKEDVQIGDTYKASADFDLNGVSVAKGDLLIANGEEDTDGYLSTVAWDHIESGADADTQYELSATLDTITLTNTVDDTTDIITLGTTDKIELDGTNNTITAIHLGTKATQTTVEAAEKDYGQTITVVTEVADDATGHVTEVKSQTITLPKDDKVVVAADAPKFEIQTDAGTKKGSIVIDEKANTPITVSGAVSGTDLTVTVEHDAITVGAGTDAAENVALSGEGKFTVISNIENDGFGHLKTIKTKEVTIGKETTYDLAGSVENKVAKVSLIDSNNIADVVEFSSETLTYTSTNANKIKVELEWGSF